MFKKLSDIGSQTLAATKDLDVTNVTQNLTNSSRAGLALGTDLVRQTTNQVTAHLPPIDTEKLWGDMGNLRNINAGTITRLGEARSRFTQAAGNVDFGQISTITPSINLSRSQAEQLLSSINLSNDPNLQAARDQLKAFGIDVDDLDRKEVAVLVIHFTFIGTFGFSPGRALIGSAVDGAGSAGGGASLMANLEANLMLGYLAQALEGLEMEVIREISKFVLGEIVGDEIMFVVDVIEFLLDNPELIALLELVN